MPTINGLTAAQWDAAMELLDVPERECSAARRKHNLRVALFLAHSGIPVLPVRADKHPYPGYKWKEGSTTDPAAVRQLWKKYPGAVPAIPTGSTSGFDVLDIDEGKGKDGLGGLLGLGFAPEDLSNFIVRTPSGGFHIYLKHKVGLTNSASHLPNAIDVRADGGYVLAPGAWSGAGLYQSNSDLAASFARGFSTWNPRLLPPPKSFTSSRATGLEPFGRVREALLAVPADCSYEEWNSCLMALHHETDGSDVGLELAQEWSSHYPDWDPSEVEAK